MDMFKITTEVRTILLDEPGIVSLVDDRIFPVIAPENTKGDFITYQRDGYKQIYTKMGVADQIPYVNVAVVSGGYNRSQELASLIYDTLSGEFSNPDMYIQLEDSTEDFIDNKFIQVLQFSIKQQ